MAAAVASSTFTSSLLSTKARNIQPEHQRFSLFKNPSHIPKIPKKSPSSSLRLQAARLPPGVELPKVEPKLEAPVLGFTKTAELWNSRACMIGLIVTFIVELSINKGILQVIGVDVGKGLNLPL